jgi:hypothetical protein
MLVFSLAKDEAVVVGDDAVVVRVLGVRGDTVDISIEELDEGSDDSDEWRRAEDERELAV